MITAIREVRRAKGLTLEDVARRCAPPTTAQTIGRADLPVTAILDGRGVHAPRRTTTVRPPQVAPGQIAVTVAGGIGDYRAGDVIWCAMLAPENFATALNRDVLVPQPAGRLAFGRMIGCKGSVILLPPGPGTPPQTIKNPAWMAVAMRLVRDLQ